MKCTSFILKCLIQFACSNLDGSQKKGVIFKIYLRKRGCPERGGSFRKRGNPTLEETVPGLLMSYSRLFQAKAQHDLVFNTFLKDCIYRITKKRSILGKTQEL